MPPKNVIIALVAAALVAILAVVLLKRREADDPATLIRAALDRAASAAEKQDVAGVMEIVSTTFKTPEMSRDDVKRILFAQLRSEAWKRVVLLDVDVRMAPKDPVRAKVTMKAVLAKGESKDGAWRDLAPTDASIYRFDLDFLLEDGDWRVRQAAYRRAGLAEP